MPANGPGGTGKAERTCGTTWQCERRRKRTGKRRQRDKKTRATVSAAHARHYGIKDSKASSDQSERIANDVSARHFPAGVRVKSGAGYATRVRCHDVDPTRHSRHPSRSSQPSAERPVLRASQHVPLIVTVGSRAACAKRPLFDTCTAHTKFCIIRPFSRRSLLFSSAAR